MVQIALAPCSPFSVTTSLMRATAALADRLDVRLHTHLAETEDENRILRRDARLPAAGLSRAMRLAQRPDLAGARHPLQRRGNEAAGQGRHHHQPLRLQQPASGLRLLPGLRHGRGRRGVGLGVDGSASNDGSNLMQEVRAAFLLQRARYGVGRVSHKDALRWATEGIGGLRRSAGTRRNRGRQSRPIWRCSNSTNCGSPVTATRWPRWCCAARIAPTGSWSAANGL